MYQNGEDNVVADALSRRPDHKEADSSVVQVVAAASSSSSDIMEEIKAAYIQDEL